ncbi:MarR family transcriptional regulator [Candidatus Woesearchaeota archaeon]|nr:MarR family transcriptional regulator [Candidatus Woesearchaeota archaeon]
MFSRRRLGTLLILLGLAITIATLSIKASQDQLIEQTIEHDGTCYLDDGTCLHEDRPWAGYITAWIVSGILIALGAHHGFIERERREAAENHEELARNLEEARKKDELNAYLAGFNDQERLILKTVHEQQGILQSTLRYRTGMSKAALSQLLSQLEEEGHVHREKKGKTNQVYPALRF